MLIKQTKVDGREMVTLTSENGSSMTIPWAEFCQIYLCGAQMNAFGETQECPGLGNDANGFDCSDMIDVLEKKITQSITELCAENENDYQTYDSAGRIVRSKQNNTRTWYA
jgi:hypothetical protein